MRPGYELYVTPLPEGEVLVAALAHQDAVQGSLRRAFRGWLDGEPLLRTWLEGATQTSELMGRAPLVRSSGALPPPGVVFLGDAAASVDPVTAGGLSLALASAAFLARLLPDALAGNARPCHDSRPNGPVPCGFTAGSGRACLRSRRVRASPNAHAASWKPARRRSGRSSDSRLGGAPSIEQAGDFRAALTMSPVQKAMACRASRTSAVSRGRRRTLRSRRARRGATGPPVRASRRSFSVSSP